MSRLSDRSRASRPGLFKKLTIHRLVFLIAVVLISSAIRAAPALPQIPPHVFQLTDFGSVGDGKTLNTTAFKNALAAVDHAGGGRLVVPRGEFLTLPFQLVSRVDLHLDAGATIQFPKTLSGYAGMDAVPPSPPSLAGMDGGSGALIGGDGLTDVAITGEGTIDGGGWAWWGRRKGLATTDASTAEPGEAVTVGRPGGLTTVGKFVGRPKMLILTHCQRVHLDGVTLHDSPMWFVVPVQCTDVTIENVKVTAPSRSPNTDALDPTACTDVLIRNCDLSEGDDNIAVKAIGGPCSNIVVENVRCGSGHGISIGSETFGGVHDVTVTHCTFTGGDNGIRIKSARDRGNQLRNFTFSNITMDRVTNPIVIDMFYSGKADQSKHEVTATTPFLSHVRISDVKITNSKNAGRIIGLPEAPVTDVVLSNVDISAKTGMTVRDVKAGVFDNVKIHVDHGEAISQSSAGLMIR